jgi:hypothetical protein
VRAEGVAANELPPVRRHEGGQVGRGQFGALYPPGTRERQRHLLPPHVAGNVASWREPEAQPGQVWRDVPEVLLGGSSLRMVTPPSTRAPVPRRRTHHIGRPIVALAGGDSGRDYRGAMDLTYPPEAEGIRGVISSWLEENLPTGWGTPGFSMTPEERTAFNEQWTAQLFAGGWICASWPTQYGGKGLTLLQQVVLNEEFARVGAPLRADFFGDTLVGPTILQWGTEEQKQQFIPGILKGAIAWCQGFSEPDAGSDLASLKTRAVLDGDQWVINGQKVWTTQAGHADYIFLLARTDSNAPKHAGISYLLVPMKQPGIEVRPIKQVDGSAEFNEVFLTDVRCPKENVIGGVNNGRWR